MMRYIFALCCTAVLFGCTTGSVHQAKQYKLTVAMRHPARKLVVERIMVNEPFRIGSAQSKPIVEGSLVKQSSGELHFKGSVDFGTDKHFFDSAVISGKECVSSDTVFSGGKHSFILMFKEI